MENAPPIKSNNPAPTVEQINADKITQVSFLDYYFIKYKNNILFQFLSLISNYL